MYASTTKKKTIRIKRGMQIYTWGRFKANGMSFPRKLNSNEFQALKMDYVPLNMYTIWNL